MGPIFRVPLRGSRSSSKRDQRGVELEQKMKKEYCSDEGDKTLTKKGRRKKMAKRSGTAVPPCAGEHVL